MGNPSRIGQSVIIPWKRSPVETDVLQLAAIVEEFKIILGMRIA